MKPTVTPVITACCVVAAGALAWQQWSDTVDLRNRVAIVTAELADKETALHEQESLVRHLREENAVYQRESALLRERSAMRLAPSAEPQTVPGAESSSPKPSGSDSLARTLDSPRMKKIFRQQRMLQLKQVYGDFAKERHFDSAQTGKFFELLTDRELSEVEEGMRFFNESDTEARAMPDPGFAGEKMGIDEQIRVVLGSANYDALKSYERTIPDRVVLAQIREQIDLAGAPLRDDQAKGLLLIMSDERARSSSTAFDPYGEGSVRDRLAALAENDNGEQYLNAQEDLQRRILNRVAAILSREQYEAFARFQEQQLEIEKIGVEMTRDLMKDWESDPGDCPSEGPPIPGSAP